MWRKRPLNITALTAPIPKPKTTVDIIKEFGYGLVKSFAAGMQQKTADLKQYISTIETVEIETVE